MAALLRAYAQGTPKTEIETRVSKRLTERKSSKEAAARLLARIEGASPASRRGVLGSAELPRAAAAADLGPATLGPAHPGLLFLMPAITLAPEGVAIPSTFALEPVGVVSNGTEDADGTDELSMFAIVARPSGPKDFQLDTVDLGGPTPTSVGIHPRTGTLYDGAPKDVLLITVMIEDYGGNAARAREEIELLVDLAASVASTLQGDALSNLQTMVDYTLALDEIGSDPIRAARSVVATRMRAGEWSGLWAADRQDAGGIAYKVAIPHILGKATHELLLDVPGETPQLETVRLSLSDLQVHDAANPYLKRLYTVVRPSIGDMGHIFEVGQEQLLPLERKVLAGNVEIGIEGSVHYEIVYPQSIDDTCVAKRERLLEGADTSAKRRKAHRMAKMFCMTLKKKFVKDHDLSTRESLDFTGAGDGYTTTYSTVLGGFDPGPAKATKPSASAPTSTPKPIRTRTTKGKGSHRGSVTLIATNS